MLSPHDQIVWGLFPLVNCRVIIFLCIWGVSQMCLGLSHLLYYHWTEGCGMRPSFPRLSPTPLLERSNKCLQRLPPVPCLFTLPPARPPTMQSSVLCSCLLHRAVFPYWGAVLPTGSWVFKAGRLLMERKNVVRSRGCWVICFCIHFLVWVQDCVNWASCLLALPAAVSPLLSASWLLADNMETQFNESQM